MANVTSIKRKSAAKSKAKSKRRPKAKPQDKGSLLDMRAVERNKLPKALLAILDEHRYVVRLLKILDAEAEGLSAAGKPDFETILSILHYITRQTDNYHHPKEDLIFARMSLSDEKVKSTIELLVHQHKELGICRRALMKSLKALNDKATKKALAEAQKQLHAYSKMLLEHMLLEEKEVFAVAYRDLREADWKQIDRKIAPVNDPIFGPVKSNRYWELFQRYVNHTVSVSAGIVPVGLIETGASRVEKYFTRGVNCAQKYWPFKNCAKNAGQGDTTSDRSVALDSGEKIKSFERGEPRYEGAARISWQASATNLFLRGTLKPFLNRISLDGVGRLTAPSSKGFKPPADIKTKAVKSKQFAASWVYPKGCSRAKRTLLYLPGGGFVFPASSFHYKVLNEMAGQLHARGMMVNYRLAPEYPFPAGLEDAVAAYRYLVEEQGVAPNEIVIAGDSAGGGLSLSLLLSIREQGLPMPLCACVFSPFTDISFSSPSMKYNRWLDPMLPTGEHMSSLDIYVGDTPVDHPLVSPVHASYEGFPPILAQVSSTETLLDDTLRAARNARAQDVKFEVEVWQGMPHVFQIITYLPESRRALRHAVEFIKKQMPYNKTKQAA